ncbi:MAG: penicillin-binding protein 2 [Elusimicrobia bacterium]|nr:penicillin-binding protein 2 [Candidatus Obscuribacterium magneticum]
MSTSFSPAGSTAVRLHVVRSFSFALFALLAARLIYIQGVQKFRLQERAERQLPTEQRNPVTRHAICDRRFHPLAETVRVESCYVDPRMLENPAQTLRELTRLLDVDEKELTLRFQKAKGSFLWVKRDVNGSLAEEIKAKKWRGVGLKMEERRHYPLGPLASHVLGLVGYEGKGLSGVELGWEDVLASKGGTSASDRALKPAGTVLLAIDSQVQQIVENELNWGVHKTGAKRGLALVQDPGTGEILAIAATPSLSLDPDEPPAAEEMRLPPLADVFEPGSTFKLVTAAGALEEKLVSPGEIFSGEKGALKIADITIHDHEPREHMTFDEIWIHSSNIGASKVADRLGTEKLYQYARLFGFGVFPGSGFPGEAKGVLRPPSRWSGISKNVVSFGQEVGVTALQLVGAYSAVANGGRLMEPIFVKAVVDGDRNVVWQASPAVVRRIISKNTADELTRILVRAVEEGTGQNARLRWGRIKVAGKTGTAQKFDFKEGAYHKDLSLVSFCGFFPAEKPRYTVLVILDELRGQRWGGTDAAPVFQRIAEQLLLTRGG